MIHHDVWCITYSITQNAEYVSRMICLLNGRSRMIGGAVRCSVLRCVAVTQSLRVADRDVSIRYEASLCCSVLQCAAVCCGVLQ